MPRKLTCEAVVNFPVPDIDQVVVQIRAMYDGQTPVTTRAIAHAFGLVEGAIAPVLRITGPNAHIDRTGNRSGTLRTQGQVAGAPGRSGGTAVSLDTRTEPAG